MKKLFLLFALVGVMVACDDKKKDDVEQKSAVDYLEAQIKVMEADDVEGFVAIAEEMYAWQKSLSSDELAAQTRESEKWFETNRSKYMSVYQQFFMKNEAALLKALQNSNLPL